MSTEVLGVGILVGYRVCIIGVLSEGRVGECDHSISN